LIAPTIYIPYKEDFIMPKMYKENEKSHGPCEHCKKIVPTTYKSAPYLYDGKTIPKVLQEFCEGCGKVIGIPQQSSKQLREYREATKKDYQAALQRAFECGRKLSGMNKEYAWNKFLEEESTYKTKGKR
jgi:hypothetical protein